MVKPKPERYIPARAPNDMAVEQAEAILPAHRGQPSTPYTKDVAFALMVGDGYF